MGETNGAGHGDFYSFKWPNGHFTAFKSVFPIEQSKMGLSDEAHSLSVFPLGTTDDVFLGFHA